MSVGSCPTITSARPRAWVWEEGASTIARMTEGTLSTSAIPSIPWSVETRKTQLS